MSRHHQAAPRPNILASAISATLLCALLHGAPAMAADAGAAAAVADPDPTANAVDAAATPTTSADSSGGTLERIVVTAQKREQATIDVPASVTALSAKRLASGGLSQLEDYVAQVPGMSITSNGGSMQVTLRGISTGLSQAAPTTAIYIDEAPIGSVNAYAVGSGLAPDLDPADLRQIEVLKGPQGTLFGAGAMGGVLRYITAGPDYTRFSGSATLGVNSVSDGGTGSLGRVSLNIPSSDQSMALRVSAFKRNEAGYIDNPLRGDDDNDVELSGGRIAFGWKFADNWSLAASALTQRRESAGSNSYEVDRITLKPVNGENVQPIPFSTNGHTALDVYNLTLRGVFGDFSLVSSTTYQTSEVQAKGDISRSYGTLLGLVLSDFGYLVRSNQKVNTDRWVQEVRLESTAFDDKLYYSGGVYFTREDNTNRILGFDTYSALTGAPRPINIPGTSIPFPDGLAKARIDTSYKEVSVFANATWSVTDKLDLQGGVRLGEDRQSYDQLYTGLLFTPATALAQKSDNRKFTWLLSALYKASDDSSFYLRLANGYRPGGPSAATPLTGMPPVVGSDSLTSIEGGWKSMIADDTVSLEASLFHTTWKDIQIQTSSAGSQYFVNGGAAISEGGEATLGWYPLAGLTLRASAGYTRAELSEDTNRVIVNAGTPAAQPLGRDGDRLPFVPKVTSSLAADYRAEVGGGWTGSIGGSVNYIGDRSSDYSGRGGLKVPGYTTVNANITLEKDAWLFNLYAKNLTNRNGMIYLIDTGLAPFTPTAPYNAGFIRPRTIGLEATYRF